MGKNKPIQHVSDFLSGQCWQICRHVRTGMVGSVSDSCGWRANNLLESPRDFDDAAMFNIMEALRKACPLLLMQTTAGTPRGTTDLTRLNVERVGIGV